MASEEAEDLTKSAGAQGGGKFLPGTSPEAW